ncbi:hypothetical protein GALL_499620 [mine drainage metagenome]|uniref:Uncharacterized protein n=1 Tax=mine drainage metagenome TaxID=410659 RepID=A0A1J5PKX7_9ZZZZ
MPFKDENILGMPVILNLFVIAVIYAKNTMAAGLQVGLEEMTIFLFCLVRGF